VAADAVLDRDAGYKAASLIWPADGPLFVKCIRCETGRSSVVSAQLHGGLCWKCWYEEHVPQDQREDDEVPF